MVLILITIHILILLEIFTIREKMSIRFYIIFFFIEKVLLNNVYCKIYFRFLTDVNRPLGASKTNTIMAPEGDINRCLRCFGKVFQVPIKDNHLTLFIPGGGKIAPPPLMVFCDNSTSI